MLDITVFPYLAIFYSNFIIYNDLKLSKPEVGSSRIIIEGSVINSTPIDVRFLSPPDIVF